MIKIQLPADRMTLREVLQTSLSLTINGKEKAAEELVRRWAAEVEQ